MRFLRQKEKRIYLDYAAATPVRLSVQEAMRPYQRELFANPSAIHKEGVQARQAIESARTKLARMLKIRPAGVIFTGSGTESNNLAIVGVLEEKRKQGRAYADMEVISTRIEHPSVTQVLSSLEERGVTVRYVEVDTDGLIVIQSLQEALTEKTVLVSFAYANSEVGVIQPVSKLVRTIRSHQKRYATDIVVHLDAAQAPLWLPCQMESLLVDILTLDAGKCYGPKGVGVLALRHGVAVAPVLYGGPQERGIRPATENTGGIVGAVEALCIAQEGMQKRAQKVATLRDRAFERLGKIDGLVINGSYEHRIANNINVSIPGIDSEFAVVTLDVAGIACSTKSACGTAKGQGSAVVQALTGDTARATSSIRFTLGEETTFRELNRAVMVLATHVEKMKYMQQTERTKEEFLFEQEGKDKT